MFGRVVLVNLKKPFWLEGKAGTECVCQLEPAAISGSLKTIYMSFAEPPLQFLQECPILGKSKGKNIRTQKVVMREIE